MLTTEELIGYRARALAKHRVHVADMRKCVSAEKQACLVKYEKDHRNKIDDRIYGPGDLVLVRNSMIKSSMSRKMRAIMALPRITKVDRHTSRVMRGQPQLWESGNLVIIWSNSSLRDDGN